MSEWKSTQQKIQELTTQVLELQRRMEAMENPKPRSTAPRPVHSEPQDPTFTPSKDEIIQDMKKFRVR